jgi:NAD(P)-dependent dehydrogenase (short-subunit alcohol dehydrogenase family)
MTAMRTGQNAGRVAFITGAGSGIGRATALAFAAQGAAVAACDNSEKAVHETDSDLGAFTVGHALVVDGGQTVGL